jgi:hypothetical protein
MSPVVLVGLVIGAILVLTAVSIFLMKKEFPPGGVAVTLIGLVMIGMSQWSTIEIEGGGIKFKALKEQVRAAAEAAEEVAAQAELAATSAETTRQQLADLTGQIERHRVLPPTLTRSIQQRILTAPTVDRAKLARARVDLQRIAGIRP